jgi:hypothetical protein
MYVCVCVSVSLWLVPHTITLKQNLCGATGMKGELHTHLSEHRKDRDLDEISKHCTAEEVV